MPPGTSLLSKIPDIMSLLFEPKRWLNYFLTFFDKNLLFLIYANSSFLHDIITEIKTGFCDVIWSNMDYI